MKKVCDINLTYTEYGALCVEDSLPGEKGVGFWGNKYFVLAYMFSNKVLTIRCLDSI